ncbi:LysR substrate-binding domain-containing protein [Streptomyces sp. M19]
MESAVTSYAQSSTPPLSLMVGSSAMHGIVPRALVTFLREHPEHDVHVRESRTPRTVRSLLNGEADLGVVVEEEARDRGLASEVLADDSSSSSRAQEGH